MSRHGLDHRARTGRSRNRTADRAETGPRTRRPPLRLGLAAVAIGLAATGMVLRSLLPAPEPNADAPTASPSSPTASAPAATPDPTVTVPWATLGANAPDPAAGTSPATGQGDPAWASLGERCAENDPYRSDICFVLGTATGAKPERTILTLGNSHTVQLSAALLQTIDRRAGWALRAQASPGCPFDYTQLPSTPCQHMWTIGTKYILERQPDLVVVMATRSSSKGPENLLPGLAEWVRTITTSTTSRVLVVRDSPRFDFDMLKCAKEHGPHSPRCAAPANSTPLIAPREALERAGAIYIDLNPYICPNGTCRPVVGGVWTYMDDNHLGADYWRTLAAPLSWQLSQRLPWWPPQPYAGEPLPRAKSTTPPVV